MKHMLRREKNYEFRKRMLIQHRSGRRDPNAIPAADEFELSDGIVIYIPEYADEVILTAARDFVDYLLISMNVSARIKKGSSRAGEKSVSIVLAENEDVNLGDYMCYRGYRIETGDAICICAYDFRGAAQALYYLEDLMNMRHAPFVKKGNCSRKPLYSPQMVHSGYGLDDYPNEHLSAIAHEGRDAILVFAKAVNLSPTGFLDFNTLIHRAARYGIDVYAYSYMESRVHPCDEGAEEFYEGTYGQLFKCCPGLAGVVLVGESVHFPSRDPRVATKMIADDGIPSIKETSFYYACPDYVDLVNVIKKVSRKYNPKADIVFWTYNFSQTPKEDRVKLIQGLPQDISLLVTFEQSVRYDLDGVTEYTADYTLCLAENSRIFEEEAEAARARGIRLYSMSNTGGMSWDFGVIPYQPAPYQWMKRYRSMRRARDRWGLCGLMESHHYGIYPSFISKLSQWCFTETDAPEEPEVILRRILEAEFGAEHAIVADRALKLWSEAAPYIIPSGEDQYGAFRIGPSYPFNLARQIQIPSAPHAMFGNTIVVPSYCTEFYGRANLIGERIWKEIDSLKKMKSLVDEGIAVLEEKEADANDAYLYLLNMGRFISCYIQTGINAKYWHTLISQFDYHRDKENLGQVLAEMETLLYNEQQNVKRAIEYVELDSRLGWEPSMEYMCDRSHLEWKLRQLEYVLQVELKNYKISLNLKA